MELLTFQKRFVSSALRPDVLIAALSLPRGNGKSSLVAHLAHRALTPGDPLFVSGTESHICASSIGQARRTVFKLLRELVTAVPDAGDYRIAEAQNACHIHHKPTGTRISVLAANSRTAQGLVRCPWVFADEPGAWEIAGGEAMQDAIETAQGKPDSELRVIYCGTLAPATGGWWHELIADGSGPGVHVAAVQGSPDKWDKASEIRRCNPLMWRFPKSRAKLLAERNQARNDTRLKARFLSFRLNLPTADESEVLLTVEDWKGVRGRPVAERFGRPVVGVDLGGGRAWSAAVAVWPSGRIEAVAVAPGTPSLRDQEKRDRVRRGTYQRLADSGLLIQDGDRRVPRVEALTDRAMEWNPREIVCDRFREGELLDAVGGRVAVTPRRTRWSEASEDIRALRRLALDGPPALSVPAAAGRLVAASLAVSKVQNDDQGSVRLVKAGTHNTARDDVAHAMTLAVGELARAPGARTIEILVA